MKIESGVGNGKWAGVDLNNRLIVSAATVPQSYVTSKEKEQAYQVSGTATLANATVVGMILKNTSTTRNMVVTYVRHQIVDAAGGTAFPSAVCYFTLNVGCSYTSGGGVVTPVNVAVGSGNIAEVEAYDTNPTIAAGTEIDRWYTKAEGDMYSYNKEGALIVQPGLSMCVSYIGDHTSGTLYSRVSFLMENIV